MAKTVVTKKTTKTAAKGKTTKTAAKGKATKTTAKGKRDASHLDGKRVGREKGVKYEIKPKYKDILNALLEDMENQFNDMAEFVGKFVEDGNKSSVMPARKGMQAIIKSGGAFRKTLQEAKMDMNKISAS